MLKKLLAVWAGLLFALTVYAATVQTVEWAEQHSDRYIVRKGDTLWDISAHFLKKPWLWPEIWQDNPQVRNPHLIYPGDELVLSNGHVMHGQGSIEPHARVTSLEDSVKPIPLSALKQFLKEARVVSEDEFKNAPHVVGLEENQLRGTPGQLAYVRGLAAHPGDKFAIVRTAGRYYDMPPRGEGQPREVYRQTSDWFDGRPGLLWSHGPEEFSMAGNVRFLGYEVLAFGTVEVTRVGDPSSVLIMYSDFEVRPGDLVLPLDQTPYDSEYLPHAPAHVPDNMRIVAFADALRAIGPRQVVAISRGTEDGVENGQTYSIYEDGEEVIDQTDYPEGSSARFFHPNDARTTLPPEFIGHMMIFRTFPRVSYGIVMDAVKPTRIGDFLWDPDHTP